MIFSSIPFLYYFLPAVILIYFLLPKKLKNAGLLCASLFFYAYGEPKYVLLMAATILVGFIAGIVIEEKRENFAGKLTFIIAVSLCLLSLALFKYAGFFCDNFSKATGIPVKALKLTLPIGISFYTFQIISYLADIYRGKEKAQRNIIDLGTYITFFGQLIAGPIVRYQDVEGALKERKPSFEKIREGIGLFIIGLSKKILIANVLGELVNAFRLASPVAGFYWVYGISEALIVYFDFSGYSDMAIGLGRIFGFELPKNFDYPFISRSATEFFRRWHITLGGWFRDYVYIPLGGNRVSKFKWVRNIIIVWFLTGFWHGADWTFIIWGLLFALLLIVEKFCLKSFLDRHVMFSYVYMFFVIVISFTIFSADGLNGMTSDIKGMFGFGTLPAWSVEADYYLRNYLLLIIAALFMATPLPMLFAGSVKSRMLGSRYPFIRGLADALYLLALIALLALDTAFLVDGSFNPFLYFRF